jgi:type IV pilus assembly protein PilV
MKNIKHLGGLFMNMKILKNRKGVALIEGLFIGTWLSFSLLSMVPVTATIVPNINVSENNSIATTLALEKLEELKNTAEITPLENSDSGTDTVDDIFTRSWTIINGGEGNLTQVSITVGWDGAGYRTVFIDTLIYQ